MQSLIPEIFFINFIELTTIKATETQCAALLNIMWPGGEEITDGRVVGFVG